MWEIFSKSETESELTFQSKTLHQIHLGSKTLTAFPFPLKMPDLLRVSNICRYHFRYFHNISLSTILKHFSTDVV